MFIKINFKSGIRLFKKLTINFMSDNLSIRNGSFHSFLKLRPFIIMNSKARDYFFLIKRVQLQLFSYFFCIFVISTKKTKLWRPT